MSNVDWSGLWAVFSGTLTVYVLAKMIFLGVMNILEKRLWKKYTTGGVGVILLILMGCATIPSYVPVVRVPEYSDAYARTMCDEKGNPVVVVYANTPKESEYYILKHESMHVLQSRREADCKTFMRRYTASAKFRLEIEAEAECAAFTAYEEDGYSPSERSLVDHMHERFPDFTEADIVEALPCVPYSPGGDDEDASLRRLPQSGSPPRQDRAIPFQQAAVLRGLHHDPVLARRRRHKRRAIQQAEAAARSGAAKARPRRVRADSSHSLRRMPCRRRC